MTHELSWSPSIELSPTEEIIIKRACKNRKLFVFLREYRHLIFDESFQEELAEMYRRTGAGLPPIPPAQMALQPIKGIRPARFCG